MEVRVHLAGGIEAVLSAPSGGVSEAERRAFWQRFYGWAASHAVEGPLWFEVGPVKHGWAPRVEQVGPGVWLAHAIYLPVPGRSCRESCAEHLGRGDHECGWCKNYGTLNPPGASYRGTLEEARAEAQRLADL